jgi:hypothetical protein
VYRGFQMMNVFMQKADGPIAVMAKKSPHVACGVIMIHNQFYLMSLCIHEKAFSSADGTYPLLLFKQDIVILFCDAVGALQVAVHIGDVGALLRTK